MLNRVELMGHLGKDPEVDKTTSGIDRARFSVATSERWTDDEGKEQERTEWHYVVAWRGNATTAGKYLKKGSLVYVEGVLRHRSYEEDGVTKYVTEVQVLRLILCGSRASTPPPPDEPPAETSRKALPLDAKAKKAASDDEIPF